MISPFTICSLNQGKLFGEKPPVEELEGQRGLQMFGIDNRQSLRPFVIGWLVMGAYCLAVSFGPALLLRGGSSASPHSITVLVTDAEGEAKEYR